MSSTGNIVSFPNSETLEAEAAAWLVRLDRDDVDPADQVAFEQWYLSSQQHQEAFKQVSQMWDGLECLADLRQLKNAATSTPTLLERAGLEMKHRFAVAAGFAAVAATSALLFVSPPSYFSGPSHEKAVIHRTVVGTQKTVTLSDGSDLLLNTDSRVEVSFTRNSRSVILEQGEVHFTVAADKSRPFSVYVDNRVVRAVGTAFVVHRRERDIEVTVTEGDVELFDRLAEAEHEPVSITQPEVISLTAGENAVIGDTVKDVTVVPEPEMNRKLAWRQGLLAFGGEPLAEVVAEVSRYTDLEIIISDPVLEELRFGGFLKVGNVDTLFNALEQSFGVRVERHGGSKVYLSRAAL